MVVSFVQRPHSVRLQSHYLRRISLLTDHTVTTWLLVRAAQVATWPGRVLVYVRPLRGSKLPEPPVRDL